MTDKDLSRTFDENRVDSPNRLQDFLAVIANTLGPLGGALSASLTTYASNKRLKNIQNMLECLRFRLEQLPVNSYQNNLGSDEFLHLCVTAMENVQKEHRAFKRKHCGTFLANASADTAFNYEFSDHLLELLDAVDELDLRILKFLDNYGVLNKSDDEWIEFGKIESLADGKQSREIVCSILQRLAFFSAIKTKGSGKWMIGTNPIGLWYVSTYSITVTGRKFIQFLETNE